MRHARADYDRIQDPAGKIGALEPVFLIRAQDSTAALAVEAWAALSEMAGAHPDIVEMARQHAVLIRVWQDEHGHKPADL